MYMAYRLPASPYEHAADVHGQGLVQPDVETDGLGAHFVFPDGQEHLAKGRERDAADDVNRQDEKDHGEIIITFGRLQIYFKTAQMNVRPLHTGQSVVSRR